MSKKVVGTIYEPTGELWVKNPENGELSIKRKCATCGNDFHASSGNVKKGYGFTCGFKCAKYFKGQEDKQKCKCKTCGKEFEEYSSRIKDGRGEYCSKYCSYVGKRKEKVVLICEYCGKTFIRNKSKSNQHFCSKRCLWDANKTGEIKKCENPNCNNEFYVCRAYLDNNMKRFCSRKCHFEIVCGENHHLWKDEKSHRDGQEFTHKQKIKILDRYGWKCPVSGKDAKNNLLHIHHIIPICKGGTNDDSNGIPLDVEVHMDVHRGKIDIVNYVII